ncbi:septum site-determining protein Ssd [Streptomyces aidingensis]|uniref:Helicase/secretion neighborhood CpaE-like protein n=1 Tax=Streptomyces aidingensis TaxID=910347 RepID=A0A1I1KTB4_9ACTN|nr:septum site-determining protein Ssd [Streptomyces aidingensis]SFC60690.1 helicase/secretion neighborhood CpaE-like protein [Streptomyces aidingensis]
MTHSATTSSAPATTAATAPVLILTEHDELLDDLLRLCAAAGAEAEVVHGTTVPAAQWERAALVLAGDDWAGRAAVPGAGPPARRAGVLLIGRDLDDHTVWARGVALGVEHVLHLPDDEPWLAERIADALEPEHGPALVLGVLGGRGGAGASTLACALAVAAARAGHHTMLVDADPLGGGLDVLLGAERAPGLRWPALAAARGRLPAGALDEALPHPRGLSLLSWDRSPGDEPLPGAAMRSVLTAARRRGGLVVLDLPRTLDEPTVEALGRVDLGLLVVPGELRAVAAARRVTDTSGALIRDLRVVAREPSRQGAGLAGPELAALLGLPLAGELPEEPGLAAGDAGEPPGADRGSPLAAFCTALLGNVLPAVPSAPGKEERS